MLQNGAYAIVNERDKNGKTASMLADEEGHTEIVGILASAKGYTDTMEILNNAFQESLQYGYGPERRWFQSVSMWPSESDDSTELTEQTEETVKSTTKKDHDG